jgi:hypothetical protein
VTGLSITQADRNIWQRRAAMMLVRLLDEHRDLPVIAWTVGSVGSVLLGRVNGLQPAATARAVFETWVAALALDERREHSNRTMVYLVASARRDSVTIGLHADLTLDDGERP